MEQWLQLRKNINRNYIYTLLQNIDFTRGIWMIYLAGKGMSLTQLGVLETIFHITSLVMEVPTGAVADIFGRKASRILGRFSSLISVIILLFANSFLFFAISFIFTALSYNLESGAGDALVYDSLKEIGREQDYMKVSGNKEVFYQLAGIVSFLAGGYLAVYSYGRAFVLTIIIGAAAIVQSLTFKEPGIGRRELKRNDRVFVKQIIQSIAIIKSKPRIGFLIIFSEAIMAFCTCAFFYLQNYLKGNGYNEAAIGIIYSISSLSSALMALQVHRLEKRIKEHGILLIIPFATALSLWGVALSKYHYIFFILLMVTEGIIFVAVSDYINRIIPSTNRATILSFASMVFSFLMITLFPFIGMIGDKYSLTLAFMVLAALGTGFAVVNSLIMARKRRMENFPDKNNF